MKEVKVKLLTAGDYDSLNMIELPVVVDGYTNDEGDELAFVRASTLKKIVNTAYGSDYPFFIGSECEIVNKTETPEEKEAFDSMSKSDSDNIHKPSWAKWSIGDDVTKIKGSSWTGKVVGYYSTCLTSKGYAVESSTEKGSVQIYPEAALRNIEAPQQREERERREEAAEMIRCLLDNYSEREESAINYVLEFLHECDYRKAK